jgi:hypothetical protein
LGKKILDMRIKYILFYLLFTSGYINVSMAQNFARPNDWKKLRKEVFIQMGASGFLGDLGGLDRVGTDYSPVDYDFQITRTAMGIGYKYKLQRWLNLVGTFNWLILKGDDKLTQEKFRHERNLNFKSNVFELAGRIEFAYFANRVTNRYSIKKTFSRRMKGVQTEWVAFVGIGGFYYNPKGYDGRNWVALKPLHTEGQGLPGGPKQYSNFSVCIPMGIGFNMYIKRQWSVGIEINWRKTFTDYIDDVSTNYYDPVALAAAYGPKSAQMADPSLGTIPGFSKPAADGTPAQRGDSKQKDSYFSVQLKGGYIFKYKRGRSRLRSKF